MALWRRKKGWKKISKNISILTLIICVPILALDFDSLFSRRSSLNSAFVLLEKGAFHPPKDSGEGEVASCLMRDLLRDGGGRQFPITVDTVECFGPASSVIAKAKMTGAGYKWGKEAIGSNSWTFNRVSKGVISGREFEKKFFSVMKEIDSLWTPTSWREPLVCPGWGGGNWPDLDIGEDRYFLSLGELDLLDQAATRCERSKMECGNLKEKIDSLIGRGRTLYSFPPKYRYFRRPLEYQESWVIHVFGILKKDELVRELVLCGRVDSAFGAQLLAYLAIEKNAFTYNANGVAAQKKSDLRSQGSERGVNRISTPGKKASLCDIVGGLKKEYPELGSLSSCPPSESGWRER